MASTDPSTTSTPPPFRLQVDPASPTKITKEGVKSFVFKRIPDGSPNAKTDVAVEKRNVNLQPNGSKGVGYKVLYLGMDPFIRDRMRPVTEKTGPRSYAPAFHTGQVMDNFGVGVVEHSNHDGFKPGDFVTGLLDMAEYGHMPESLMGLTYFTKLDNPMDLPQQYFLGPLGIAGKTAWIAYNAHILPRIKTIAVNAYNVVGNDKTLAVNAYNVVGEDKTVSVNTKEQECHVPTIWISSAASATGQMLCQLIKLGEHGGDVRIIGSSSSYTKGQSLKNTRMCDETFNYTYKPANHFLKQLAPGGLDIFVDMVGGDQAEAAVENLVHGGMIVRVGWVADIDNADPHFRVKQIQSNDQQAAAKKITVHGRFLWSDEDVQQYLKNWNRMHAMIEKGAIKVNMKEYKGIDKAPEAMTDMMTGNNFGKAYIKVTGAWESKIHTRVLKAVTGKKEDKCVML